jgi:bifunctional non-homologous end joining protein LigD
VVAGAAVLPSRGTKEALVDRALGILAVPRPETVDLLGVNGRDVRKLPLVKRKRILRDIVPSGSRSVLFAYHLPRRGRDLFAVVCERDLEGIVAKWRYAPYNPEALPLSWVKIKNRQYSQARDRHELFQRQIGR